MTTDFTPAALRTTEERPTQDGIIRNVLYSLGRPENLHTVQVKPVCAGKYRVNVYVRAEFATCRVAHSYFVEADAVGQILTASPPIVRLY